jgi:hypothetical protein
VLYICFRDCNVFRLADHVRLATHSFAERQREPEQLRGSIHPNQFLTLAELGRRRIVMLRFGGKRQFQTGLAACRRGATGAPRTSRRLIDRR